MKQHGVVAHREKARAWIDIVEEVHQRYTSLDELEGGLFAADVLDPSYTILAGLLDIAEAVQSLAKAIIEQQRLEMAQREKN